MHGEQGVKEGLISIKPGETSSKTDLTLGDLMPEDIANKLRENDNEEGDGSDIFHYGSHEDPRDRDAHGSYHEGSRKEASVKRRNERRESDEEEFTDEEDDTATGHGVRESSDSDEWLSNGEEKRKADRDATVLNHPNKKPRRSQSGSNLTPEYHKPHMKSLATLARDLDAEVLDLKVFLRNIYASKTQELANIVVANNRLATISTQLQELENLAAKAERRGENTLRKRRTAVETEYRYLDLARERAERIVKRHVKRRKDRPKSGLRRKQNTEIPIW
ncbi:MAG: hypothetical protein Q9215_005096 [Flavoplaca cf. flavocitrina]